MTTPAMMKYYAEIMNPKPKKQKKSRQEREEEEESASNEINDKNNEPDTFNIGRGLLPTPTSGDNQQPTKKKTVKRPWEVRHQKMEKTFNPELEQNGLPTSFASKGKRKDRD